MEIWHIQRNEEKTGYPEGTCKRLKPLWSAAEHLEPTLSVLRALPQTEGKRTIETAQKLGEAGGRCRRCAYRPGSGVVSLRGKLPPTEEERCKF